MHSNSGRQVPVLPVQPAKPAGLPSSRRAARILMSDKNSRQDASFRAARRDASDIGCSPGTASTFSGSGGMGSLEVGRGLIDWPAFGVNGIFLARGLGYAASSYFPVLPLRRAMISFTRTISAAKPLRSPRRASRVVRLARIRAMLAPKSSPFCLNVRPKSDQPGATRSDAGAGTRRWLPLVTDPPRAFHARFGQR